MTPISHLANQIKAAFPLALVNEDPPAHDGGNYHLDIRLDERLVVIEWRPSQGLGISLVSEAALDDGPDFRTMDVDEALHWVAGLLHNPSSHRLDRDPEWRRAA
jgi:hypothetical protein